MVTRIEKSPNCFLINAPAGSGKTTKIENMILDLMGENKASSILCITFTNRAADELLDRIDLPDVDISTIHSFINNFVSIYFNHSEIISLYFELFENKIIERIQNPEGKKNINRANEEYKEKNGELNFATIQRNVKKLFYNELAFSSIYNGGLSHDDLLYFTNAVMYRFPKIQRRLSQKYDYIFIDEYQDTSADVLRLFYNAVQNTNSKLYLLGDKIQQIYKNYDGSFEQELMLFNQDEKLNINYRSTKSIVNVLNCIYNNEKYVQTPYNKNLSSEKPKVFLRTEPKTFIDEFVMENPDTLQLVVFNRERFKQIESEKLFQAFKDIKRYSFGGKYSIVDALSLKESPDDLINFLTKWHQIYIWFKEERYGSIIQMMRNKLKLDNRLLVREHKDKVELKQVLSDLFFYYEKNDVYSIKEWLIEINNKEFMDYYFLDAYLVDEEYNKVLSTPLREFKNLCDYQFNEYPKVSTQHGVKGEGHDEVLFVANNATNPNVKIYEFFDIWANNDIEFTNMQQFYYDYKQAVDKLKKELPVSISNITKNVRDDYWKLILDQANAIYETSNENKYFQLLYMSNYEKVINPNGKPTTVQAVKDLFKISKIEGIVNAYKLFYVGCSRAKKNLFVLLDEQKIIGDKQKLIQKFEQCGFKIGE